MCMYGDQTDFFLQICVMLYGTSPRNRPSVQIKTTELG